MGDTEFTKFLQTTYKQTRRRTMEANNAKRVEKHKENRKANRGKAYMDSRNIIEEKPEVPKPKPKETGAERLSRLKIWQAEKNARKLAENKTKKPIFRAGVVTHKGNTPPVFTDVKNIKIKKLPPLANKRMLTMPATPAVVKRSTIKKNLNLKVEVQPRTTIKRKLPFSNESPKNMRVTRSQKATIVAGLPERPKRRSKKDSPKITKPKVADDMYEGVFKFTGTSPEKIQTPKKSPANLNTSVNYISPFVSVGRGKGSSRKEVTSRKSKVFEPKEGSFESRAKEADYFETVLDNEITRLLGLCKEWEEYKTENLEQLSEDSQDFINLATGQTNLLISKKFEQFRGLIKQCRQGSGEQKVTATDLQGFWDMIYMQVENLDVRFNNLAKLRNNNWEEEKPKPVIKKIVKPKANTGLKKATKASSSIKSFMKAARNKANLQPTQEGDTVNFNGGFFNISSPKSSPRSIKSSPRTPAPKKPLIDVRTPVRSTRNTLLKSVLSAEANRRSALPSTISQSSSPIILMKVNSNSKRNLLDLSMNNLDTGINGTNENIKTTKRTDKKSPKENVRESFNLISWDTPEGSPRNKRTKRIRQSPAEVEGEKYKVLY